MKKKFFAVTAALLIIASGCRKDTQPINRPASSDNIVATLTAPLTPGEAHNAIVAEYKARHGLVFHQPVTTMIMIGIQKNMLLIAKDKGQLDQSVDIDQYAVDEVEAMIRDGFFTAAGVLKPKDEINEIGLNTITTVEVKTAIKTIVDYSGTSDNFMAAADAALSGLTDLSEADRKLVEGYRSVLASSFEYWNNNYEAYSNPVAVAKADGNGYLKGFRRAYELGYWWLAGTYAEYYAAKCSIAAL